MPYEQEQQIAIAGITLAAQLCEQVRHGHNLLNQKKADQSPVTVADFGSQAIICQALTTAFPDDTIMAEEDGNLLKTREFASILKQVTQEVTKLGKNTPEEDIIHWINQGKGSISPRYWTLDPIDGTKGYIRGDQYAIALALIEAGRVQLGILACPALPLDPQQPQQNQGVIFLAIRGQGSKMISFNGAQNLPIHVSLRADMGEICRIESVESSHSDRNLQNVLDQTLGLTQSLKQMDSQAKYGTVARGEADLYVRIPLKSSNFQPENIWDHAAGAILVEEAGGKVTDLSGKPLDFSLGAKLTQNYGIVVSNGAIHSQVIATLEKVLT
jgi:3'(2'), 5'-bisphosphate nucleotidase